MRLLQRVGILAFLLFIIFQFDTYAKELDTSWSNKCTSEFGAIPTGKNPSFQHINCLLTNAAVNSNIPPEVVKAVAYIESGWRQFNDKGTPYVADDNGIGIMQLTDKTDYDQEKLKTDIVYNIQAGIDVLNDMYNNRTELPKIQGAGRLDIENWYFAVMAYNGTVHANSPLYRATGLKNTNAYQEKVFNSIYNDSFLLEKKYNTSIPFNLDDLNYKENYILGFNKKEYELTDRLNASNYFFEAGDQVITTTKDVKLRDVESQNLIQALPKYTVLTINDNQFKYTKSDAPNQFVWYPVKTMDGKEGIISSAYITNNRPLIEGTVDKEIEIGMTFDAKEGITAFDAEDKDLTKNIQVEGSVDNKKAGTYTLTYSVTDQDGNKVIATRKVTVLGLPKITSLKLTSRTANSIKLTWTNENGKFSGISGYEIYNSKTGKLIAKVNSNTNSYTINNLSPNTSYQFKVKSYNKYGIPSPYSSTLTALTSPAQVTNLKASNTANSVKLTWTKQSGVSGYAIYNAKTGKLIAKINSNTNSYTINKLSPGTSYQFKVRSYNTAGTGAYSTTLTTVTPTAQVTNLKVSSRTTNSLKLTWTKQSGVTGYQIYQYDSKSKTYKLYKTITSNTNSYTISKLGAGTTYSYKVRSYKTISKVNYYGAFSSQLTTTTNPATVTLSSVKKASSTSMKVNWKKVTASTGYQIQYSTSNKFTSNTTKTVTIKNKNTVTNTIKSLKKGKKYYVRVRSYVTLSKTNYYGSWSTVKNITLK